MNNIIETIVNAFNITVEPDMYCSYNGSQFLSTNWIKLGDESVTSMYDIDEENEDENEEHTLLVYVNKDEFEEHVFEGTEEECNEFVEKLYDAMFEKFKNYEGEQREESKKKYLANIDEAIEYLTVKSPCTSENLLSDGWFNSNRDIAVHVAYACERYNVSVDECFNRELFLA